MAATLYTSEPLDQVFLSERIAGWPSLVSPSSSQSTNVMFPTLNLCRLLEPEGRTCKPYLSHHCGACETEREILEFEMANSLWN